MYTTGRQCIAIMHYAHAGIAESRFKRTRGIVFENSLNYLCSNLENIFRRAVIEIINEIAMAVASILRTQ